MGMGLTTDGSAEMKGRVSHRSTRHGMSGNEHVRVEMQTFLQALASYADRFATDPKLTFEEHHTSLMIPTRTAVSRAAARGGRSH